MLDSRGPLVLAVVIATVAAAGCATAPQEVDLPPQTLTEGPTSTAEQEAALVASGRNATAEAVDDAGHDLDLDDDPHAGETTAPPGDTAAGGLADRKHTIVIQSGGSDPTVTPRSLAQASATERDRRAGANAPVAIITNQNLAEQAEGGQVTVIGPDGRALPAGSTSVGEGSAAAAASPAVAGTAGSGTAPSAADAGAATTANAATKPAAAPAPSAALTEEYWRSQALKIRLDWKNAVEEVDLLEGEVADLRRRFYQEDDPFYRDNEIKPEWDRTLDRLQEAKTEAEIQERKLARFLEEGRRSGALPGWLREGVEYEPPPSPDRSPPGRRRADDPWEPKVLEEEPRDP